MNLTLCKFCMKQVDILVQSSRLFFFWLRTKNCDLWAGANFFELAQSTLFSLVFSLFDIWANHIWRIQEVCRGRECWCWAKRLRPLETVVPTESYAAFINQHFYATKWSCPWIWRTFRRVFTLLSDINLIELAQRQKGFFKKEIVRSVK